MNMKHAVSVLLLSLVYSSTICAQETNYWFHNFGALSVIKGGIETAGVRNTSAAYYNPAALAFIDGQFLEGQADVVTMDAINIEDAGGDNIDLNSFTVNIQPSMLAYLRKMKNPRWTFSFGGLSRYDFNNAFLLTHEQTGNYLSPADRIDVFQGIFRYNNRTRENWVIAAFGYRLAENIGLGLATNIYIRTTDFSKSYNASAFPEEELVADPTSFSNLTSQNDFERLDYRSLGFIFKTAISFDYDDLKFGLTMTLPAINLGLLNNFTERAQQSARPDETVPLINISDTKKFYSGVYKTPLSVNLGISYDFGRFEIAAAVEWFSKIDRYDMIEANDSSEDLQFPPSSDPNFAIPQMAHRSIINAGLTWEHEFKEVYSYIGSFRTDFSYFDTEALNRNVDFVPIATTWDIYHFTSGIRYQGPRTALTLGFNLGLGQDEDYRQFVDMTGASQSNFLRGNPDTIGKVSYTNFSVTLGFNFNIDWKKGLETDDI